MSLRQISTNLWKIACVIFDPWVPWKIYLLNERIQRKTKKKEGKNSTIVFLDFLKKPLSSKRSSKCGQQWQHHLGLIAEESWGSLGARVGEALLQWPSSAPPGMGTPGFLKFRSDSGSKWFHPGASQRSPLGWGMGQSQTARLGSKILRPQTLLRIFFLIMACELCCPSGRWDSTCVRAKVDPLPLPVISQWSGPCRSFSLISIS